MKESFVLHTKRIFKIAFPIMISNIISQVQMLIDKIFLGRMDPLYMSAIGNVSNPLWMTMSVCFSLSMGASILISQSIGAKDTERMEEYSSAIVKWHSIIPVALFFFWTFCSPYVFRAMGVSEKLMPMCLTYIRWFAPCFLILGVSSAFSVIMQTSNYTKPLILYGAVRSALNVFLDWVMIFGNLGFPEMGITGAAIATTIAEYAGLIVSLFVVLKSPKLTTRPSLGKVLKAKIRPYLKSVKLGLNVGLEDLAWNSGNIVLLIILNEINEMAAGIYTIIFGIEILAVVLIGSIGNGTLTLTSEATGQNSVKNYKGVSYTSYALCAIVSAVTLILCIIMPKPIIGIFTKDPEIINSSTIYLIFMGINLFSKSGNIIVGNALRGSGNTQWMFYTQIFGTLFVTGTAALLVFVFHLGISGVFLAVLFDEFFRFSINAVKLIFTIRKWEKSAVMKVQ